MQLVSPAVDVQLQSGQIPDSSVEALQRQLAELVDVPFDLQAGPLWRVHVLSEPDSKPASHERHILLLLFHHIVADGWSMNVLYAELQHYYGQACRQGDRCHQQSHCCPEHRAERQPDRQSHSPYSRSPGRPHGTDRE